MSPKVMSKSAVNTETLSRILREGFGPGAWHGPDLAAAIADVPSETAFVRPAPGRHNIAEIVVHHAWVVRNVVAQVTGRAPAAFPLEGEDWFDLSSAADMGWEEVVGLVRTYHGELEAAVGSGASVTVGDELFDVVLGVTCHAVYHAGQVQLVKRLAIAPAF